MADPPVLIVLPVDRTKGLVNGVLWSMPAALVGLTAGLTWARVDFRPSGVSNGIVEVSLAILAVTLTMAAAMPAFLAVRWFLLAVWPTRLDVCASEEKLAFRLGPFGSRSYDAAQLTVLYPFEIAEEVEDGQYEALLSPEAQRDRLIPRILHPQERDPLQRIVLRFVGADESSLAHALAPVIERWRTRRVVEPVL